MTGEIQVRPKIHWDLVGGCLILAVVSMLLGFLMTPYSGPMAETPNYLMGFLLGIIIPVIGAALYQFLQGPDKLTTGDLIYSGIIFGLIYALLSTVMIKIF